MSVAATSLLPPEWTFADVHAHLGGVPLERIRLHPPAGTATEQDVLEAESRYGCLCELIDGVLVEKTMGTYESILASYLGHLIQVFLDKNDLGLVAGADGLLKILPNQVRIPDVGFISWDKFPGRKLPEDPIYEMAPDLAVEVLSPGNTEAEMERKLRDYFTAGVRLVWYIDPSARSARSFTSPDDCTTIDESGFLSGGEVLPGFGLRLSELFQKTG